MVDDTSVAEGALASENVVIVTDMTVAANATATETWAYTFVPGGVISETATASDSFTLGSAVRSGALSDSAAASETWALSRTASASDSAAASETWALTVQNIVRETARASATILVSASFHISSVSAATATETWVVENTRSISDNAVASDHVSFTYVGGVQISDSAVASDTFAPRRTLNIALNESAQASVVYGVAAAYNLTLIENALVSDRFSLNNDVTAWAINSRTQFISEYQNFDFNSFAQMGRRFIAADENGLYALEGPTDDGLSVVGRLGGGFFAPNGPKQAGFKAAYIGARGQGNYLLKVIAGDGREWVYRAMLNPNLMTTKINMGKGLHARYYAWELIAEDGQDFDLDTLEFIPAMSGRRV